MRTAAAEISSAIHRRPDVGRDLPRRPFAEEPETRRQDTDDREFLLTDGDRESAERPPAQLAAPESVAHDGGGCASRTILCRSEPSSDLWHNREGLEEAPRGTGHVHPQA